MSAMHHDPLYLIPSVHLFIDQKRRALRSHGYVRIGRSKATELSHQVRDTMASTLIAMASNLIAMKKETRSNLCVFLHVLPLPPTMLPVYSVDGYPNPECVTCIIKVKANMSLRLFHEIYLAHD